MEWVRAVPLLGGGLVGLLLGLLAWAAWRLRNREAVDGLLAALSVLSVLGLGLFIAYLLLGSGP